jgi:hypothetical protein
MPRKVPAHVWLLRLAKGAPVPPTILVPCDAAKIQRATRRLEMGPLVDLCDRALDAAHRLGYPVFVRHEGGACKDSKLCVARSEEDLARAISCALSAPGAEDSCHLMLRRHVSLTAPMELPGGRPVAREFEVHAEGGFARCIHPSWKWAVPVGGEQVFARLYALSVDDQAAMASMVRRAASGLKGGWRLDVAQATGGSWCILGVDRAKVCPLPSAAPSFTKL